MVFEVACDGVVEVYAVSTLHVVSIARIGEEVGVGVGIDAGTHEGEGMLRHTHGVISSVDDEKAALEVLRLVGCPYSVRHTSPRRSASR